MNLRAQYLLQIFEKIGAPLLAALGGNAAATQETDPDKALAADTQQTAELLAKSVQLSIDLGKMASIETAEESEADTLRVALAALAGPMIAGQYKQLGRAPSDQDLSRITSSLEAVLTFSENFAGDADHTAALENLRAEGQAVSAHQTNIQYLHLFIPVIEAVGKFAFGQQDKTLMRDIAGRLSNEAKLLRGEIFGESLSADEAKRAELGLLRTLAQIYAGVHERAIAKAAADGGDIKMVWDAFEIQLSMLQTLGENLAPDGNTSAGAAPTAAAPVAASPIAAVVAPTEPVAPAAPPPTDAPASPLAPPPADTPPATQGGGGPMSFFSTKPSDEPAAAAPETPVTPPASPVEPPPTAPPTTPPTTPATTPETAPPPVAPVETPPVAPPPSDAPSTDTPPAQNTGGGGPMSFFTKKDDDGAGEASE